MVHMYVSEMKKDHNLGGSVPVMKCCFRVVLVAAVQNRPFAAVTETANNTMHLVKVDKVDSTIMSVEHVSVSLPFGIGVLDYSYEKVLIFIKTQHIRFVKEANELLDLTPSLDLIF
jgi:hypothetical protein